MVCCVSFRLSLDGWTVSLFRYSSVYLGSPVLIRSFYFEQSLLEPEMIDD